MFRCIKQNKHTTVQILKRYQSSSSQQVQHYPFPQLSNLTSFKESGVPGLFSQKGLKNAYTDRIELHLQKLNEELNQTSIDSSNDLDILVDELSKSSKDIKIFNNASLIHNICFALGSIGAVRDSNSTTFNKPSIESLLQSPDITNEILNIPGAELLKQIEDNFGSLIEFKTLLLNSANAINGDGFTWVVARGENHTSSTNVEDLTFDNIFILNTYNAGSPNNSNKAGILNDLANDANHLYENAIVSIEEAKTIKSIDSKITYKPILAIDASPKAYLNDYGVFGKRLYLEQLWKAIDWDVVSTRMPKLKQRAI